MKPIQLELFKFDKAGEKTGWTYIVISEKLSKQLNPGVKKSYRVKGFIDAVEIKQMALIPMGDGSFILPIKADLRKKLKKVKGHKVRIDFELDNSVIEYDAEFIDCLSDSIVAEKYFNSLTPSHRLYFSKWVASANTIDTKSKRITSALLALENKMGFPEMLRSLKVKI